MAEEPALPRLPGVSWDEPSQSFSNNPRKRVRLQRPDLISTASFNSSDPAVFSSDDDPGVDNYVDGRRKRRYIGSWFQQHPASSDSLFSDGIYPQKSKRTLERQVDSGVFLGSDGAESEDMDFIAMPLRPKLPQLDRPAPARTVVIKSKAELAAEERIRACVDNGNETVDLWSMGLDHISNDTISPLSQLSCIPVVAKDVAFEQKDPQLKLYLANNMLSRVPGAIFDLINLTTLSLRGNDLKELPQSIAKLRNLRELNVAQNKLSHLPIELLDLLETTGSLQTLVLRPNPLMEHKALPPPPQAPYLTNYFNSSDFAAPFPRLISRRAARTPVQERDSTGRITSRFRLHQEGDAVLPVILHEPDGITVFDMQSACGSEAPKGSAVPSLLESALRACYRSAELPDLGDYLPDTFQHLRRLVDRAVEQKDAGGVLCSGCKRLIVTPALEWIEWRTLWKWHERGEQGSYLSRVELLTTAPDEAYVPFLYKACSERCGPDKEPESIFIFPKFPRDYDQRIIDESP